MTVIYPLDYKTAGHILDDVSVHHGYLGSTLNMPPFLVLERSGLA